jgi:hypothetical protein
MIRKWSTQTTDMVGAALQVRYIRPEAAPVPGLPLLGSSSASRRPGSIAPSRRAGRARQRRLALGKEHVEEVDWAKFSRQRSTPSASSSWSAASRRPR